MNTPLVLGVAFGVAASQVGAHDFGKAGQLDLPLASITVVSTAAALDGITIIHPITDEVIHVPPIENCSVIRSS